MRVSTAHAEQGAAVQLASLLIVFVVVATFAAGLFLSLASETCQVAALGAPSRFHVGQGCEIRRDGMWSPLDGSAR